MRMKHWLAVLWLAGTGAVWADKAEVGKPFPPYTVQDAFEQTNVLQKTTRFVIVASEKSVSEKVNEWLKTKAPDYLPRHATEYVSDITPMPGIITELFARPKMKKYPFKILLARDEAFAKTYPSQPGKIALFVLDDQQVLKDLKYVATPAELEAPLNGTAAAAPTPR